MSASQHFAAILLQDGAETTVGTVTIDANGMIHAEDANADPSGKLARMIEESNAAKIMNIDVAPRDDAPEFTLASAIIKRGDPRFLDALKEQALTYYGIDLRPQ